MFIVLGLVGILLVVSRVTSRAKKTIRILITVWYLSLIVFIFSAYMSGVDADEHNLSGLETRYTLPLVASLAVGALCMVSAIIVILRNRSRT